MNLAQKCFEIALKVSPEMRELESAKNFIFAHITVASNEGKTTFRHTQTMNESCLGYYKQALQHFYKEGFLTALEVVKTKAGFYQCEIALDWSNSPIGGPDE